VRPTRQGRDGRGRRALGAALTFLVSAAGVIGLLVFFAARDASQLSEAGTGERGPGVGFADQGARHLARGQRPPAPYNSRPPTSGPHAPAPIRRDEAPITDDQLLHALEQGNVVLLYGTDRAPPALRTLADGFFGFDRALIAGGQGVILARRAGTRGVVALAWRRMLRTSAAADPQLQAFVEFWLGRGAG